MNEEERGLVEEQRCSSCGSTGHRRGQCYVPTSEIDTPEGLAEADRQARARGLEYQPGNSVWLAAYYREQRRGRRAGRFDFRPVEDEGAEGADLEFVAVAAAWGMFS